MIDADNYGQYGGFALKDLFLKGHAYKVNDTISPEILQSVPHKNVRALSSTQQVHLYEEPRPSDTVPEVIKEQPKDETGPPAKSALKVKDDSVIESTAKRIPDDTIEVGDTVQFRFEGNNVTAKVAKISSDKKRAVVEDDEGKLEVKLSYCTKL